MWRVFGGAALVTVGIVALIEAHAHRRPPYLDLAKQFGGSNVLGILTLKSRGTVWSPTAYDIAHIGGTTLLVIGALLMIVGLVALARQRRSA